MSTKKDQSNNLFSILYLTGATVGSRQTDIQVQKSEEVQNILGSLGIEASEFVAEADTSPVFRVDTALVNDRWEDAWQSDDSPVRFASRAEAQRAIDDHIQDLRLANMDGATNDDYRIEQEPAGRVTFLEIPLALSKEHSALTVALAQNLSSVRSPAHSAVGAMNMIRELTNAHPDVDPQRIDDLVNALDHALSGDMKGAAIVSLATIMHDGGAEELNKSLQSLSHDAVYSGMIRERAKSLQEFVENASDSMTPEAMLDATKIIPPEAPPAPERDAAPTPRQPGPTPSM